MAKVVRTVTELTDDIDGDEAVETIFFALDGTAYEIDLNEGNALALRESLSDFIGHGRKAGRVSARKGPGVRRGAVTAGNVAEIRSWAKAKGLAVSERGRISGDVMAAFEAAH